jgi:hypothetical protein
MSALSQKRAADIRAAIELVRLVLEADIAEVVQKLPGHRAMRIDPLKSSPGKYSGQDNGWALSLIYAPLIEFDKSIIKYPNIRRFPGGASNDLRPNLQDPSNPVPAMDPNNPPRIGGSGG